MRDLGKRRENRIRAGIGLVILRKRIAGLSASTLERFLLRARRAVRLRGTVNVLVTTSHELRSLNLRFRGKNKPTDVLSFPESPVVLPKTKQVAGDLAISGEIARENANRLGHSLATEIKILTLHGILHLAGFDHERDNGEMAREEYRLRLQLKLEPGLIERTQSGNGRNLTDSQRRNKEPRNSYPLARRRKV
jgi:probable rRNA maturation factor